MSKNIFTILLANFFKNSYLCLRLNQLVKTVLNRSVVLVNTKSQWNGRIPFRRIISTGRYSYQSHKDWTSRTLINQFEVRYDRDVYLKVVLLRLNYMKKLFIGDLKKELGYKDDRSVRRWCKRHSIDLTECGNTHFVYETAFKEVIERPFITKLKEKFGENWKPVYELYASGNISALAELNDVSSSTFKIYRPNNHKTKDYLNALNDYARI